MSEGDFIDDFGELFDLRVTFGFAHFLNNDLLRRLSDDAANNLFVVQQLLAMTTGNFTRLALNKELDISLIAEVPSRSGNLRHSGHIGELPEAVIATQLPAGCGDRRQQDAFFISSAEPKIPVPAEPRHIFIYRKQVTCF